MRAPRTVTGILIAALVAISAVGGPARAADSDRQCWTLRGVVARMDTDHKLFLDLGPERRASILTSGSAVGASYELRPGCRWGFEVGLLAGELDSLFVFDQVAPDFWGKQADGVRFSALTLGPLFHLTPGRKADVWVGPLVAVPDLGAGSYPTVNMLDDPVEPERFFRQEFEAALAWGFKAGVDYRLGEDSPWAVNAGVTYLELEVDTGPALAGAIDVDPVIWTAGISYSPSGCRGECGDVTVDPCDELRDRLGELDCRLCPDQEECRGPPTCEECRALDCLNCLPDACGELCPPRCDECPPPTCPEGQVCRPETPSCDEFPEHCLPPCPDCAELGCDRPPCPPGTSCRPPCPLTCPPGLDCRPDPTCEDLLALDCLRPCLPPTCEDVLALDCEDLLALDCAWPCPLLTCEECRGLDCPDRPKSCEDCPTPWGICCLILTFLVAAWLFWWLFRRQRLPIRWFWLWILPLLFMLAKLWFFQPVATWVWLWWLLLIGLALLALFVLLSLLRRKGWIRLPLATFLALALLAFGRLAGWSWLWWFLLVGLALLLAGYVWRLARGESGDLVPLILVAVLAAVSILLGPLAAFDPAWWLLLGAVLLLLLRAMWRWHCRGEEHPAIAPVLWIVLLAAAIHAGWTAAATWFPWFLPVLAVAILIYVLRRWIGDPRFIWLVLVVVLLAVLLWLGPMAGWGWLWWFLLTVLMVLLLYLLWRLVKPRTGPEGPAVWLVLIAIPILVLLLLGGTAGYGWLWWFLLCASGLLLLWAVWRLLGSDPRGAWLLLGLPLVVMLVLLGVPTGGAWLGWLLAILVVLCLLYLVSRRLCRTEEPGAPGRIAACLLVLLLLALLGIGHLAGWSGHWWLVLLAVLLALAAAVRRLSGAGGATGLARLVWLGLLLIAIVVMILLSGDSGVSWLYPVLLCALLALLPLAVWALAGPAGPSLGAACAAGVGSLRDYQRRLEPIAEADPARVRDLFLAYRDNRGWSEMYGLYEEMPEELRGALEVRQQLAFALNRDGRDREAEDLLLGLESDGSRSSESWGLLGRIYKDRWDAARKLVASGEEIAKTAAALLARAIDAYLAGHRAGGGNDPYPGINALTLLEFDDDRRRELREGLLGEVAAALEEATDGGAQEYWHQATRLELALHLDDEEEARDALRHSLELARSTPTTCPQVWKLETTCRNLQLIAAARSARGEEQPPWVNEVIGTLCGAAAGDLLARFLALRDRRAWSAMYALHESMPAQLQQSVVVRQQLAFALNRDGRDQEAEAVLLALLDEEGPSAETCGLLGRVHKDRWDAARRGGDERTAGDELERAIESYLEGHETGERDPYPGINALTLSGFSERWRDELGGRLPGELADHLASSTATGYWHQATRLELAIHRGSERDARGALEGAVEAAGASGAAGEWMVESTCRNLRLLDESYRQRGERPPVWLGELIAALEEAY